MERSAVVKTKEKSSTSILLLIAVIAIIGTMQVTFQINPDAYWNLADAYYIIIPAIMTIFAVGMYLKLYKDDHSDSKSFLYLAMALTSNFIGEQIWTYYKSILEIEPYPSLGDVFFLLFYPLTVIFLMKYLKFEFSKFSKANLIFVILIPAAFLYPTLQLTYEYNIEESNIGMLFAIAYTTFDAVILGFAMLSALRHFKENKNNFWIYLNLGIFVWIIANTVFLYAVTHDEYYDGHIVDALWPVSYALWLFAIYDFYKNVKQDSKYSIAAKRSQRSNYTGINKLAIPLIVATLISVSILAMVSLGFFELANEQGIAMSAVIFIFILLAVFSSLIILVYKNLSRLVYLREMELDEKNKHLIRLERYSAIGEVSARISHDIRNPLSVIKNGMEIMFQKHQDHLSEFDYATMDRINRSTFRITHQIDDVLDFVKERYPEFSNERIDELLKSSLIEVPDFIRGEIKIDPTDATINCDKGQIQRVFVNLLINAVQAAGKEGQVNVRTIEEEKYITIQFEDSGPGIPEEIGNKIFTPLFTTKQEGTGLGLSICKKIIEQHNGHISFKNNPTVFKVKLPK